MRPLLLLLLLAAGHVSVLVDCRPRVRDERERPSARRKSGVHARLRAETPAGPGGFSSETGGSGKRDGHTGLLVVLPEKSDFVSIFDLRRKHFLCLDPNGELYVSRQRDMEQCLFQHIWIDAWTQYDVFYSTNGLFRLTRDEQRGLGWARPEALSAPLQLLLGSLVKRQRRSEEVNPSDPLRTHSDPPPHATEQKETAQQPEQDQAGAVSKETINSCDDPLKVLQQNGPISPVKDIADGAEQGAEQD